MQYNFVIKNVKTKKYKAISQLLIIFNLLGFILLFLKDETVISKNYWLLFSIFATGAYTFFAFIEWLLKKPVADSWHRFIFGYCAVSWYFEKYWWLSIILLMFVLLDILSHRKLVVSVTDKKIIIPSFPVKEAGWNELNNLILKDDLLTIDFKNNKLFQHLVFNSDKDVNEKEFNEFCKSRLTIDN